MAQTILPTASNQPEEWKPTWTVITSPPGLAERWAMRQASGFFQRPPALPLVTLAYLAIDAIDTWNKGDYGHLQTLFWLGLLVAASAWDRYGFGMLVARYDAELRELQARRPTA